MPKRCRGYLAVSIAIAALVAVAAITPWHSLQARYLIWRLDGWRQEGFTDKGHFLVNLLKMNGDVSLPSYVDLTDEETTLVGAWFGINSEREVFYVSVIPREGTHEEHPYAFIFDERGRLLGHMRDGPVFFNSGFIDFDRDGDAEKIVSRRFGTSSAASPQRRVEETRVFQVRESGLECVFRVQSGDRQDATFFTSTTRVSSVDEQGFPVVQVEVTRTVDDSWEDEVVASFTWDPDEHTFVGPEGGPDSFWQVLDCPE